MSANKSNDEVAAHLFLDAVLPAFEDLTLVSERARSLIARWRCAVEFAVRNGGAATISFDDGAISVTRGRNPASALSLLFLSPRQLINQFSGRGIGFPLLRRGFLRPQSLLRFQKLGKIFETEIANQPRLLLRVAVTAIRSLGEHDDEIRRILRDSPVGVAQLGIPTSNLFGWVKIESGRIDSGRGRAPRSPDVLIEFRNEQIALAALRGELDELAATGNGDLRVRGLLPLAEIVGVVAERVNRYLPRPRGRARETTRVILSEAKDLALPALIL